jgi:hypothetical protein
MTTYTDADLLLEEQELFNQIVSHLRSQNAICQRMLRPGIPQCMYRSPDGLKCAVGCLIPDDEYVAVMEDHDLYLVIDMLKSPLKEKLKRHTQLLIQMQLVHDSKPVSKWEAEFKGYATRNGLVLPAKETTNEEGDVADGVQLVDIVGDSGDHLPGTEGASTGSESLDIGPKENDHGEEEQAEGYDEDKDDNVSQVEIKDPVQAEGSEEGKPEAIEEASSPEARTDLPE